MFSLYRTVRGLVVRSDEKREKWGGPGSVYSTASSTASFQPPVALFTGGDHLLPVHVHFWLVSNEKAHILNPMNNI